MPGTDNRFLSLDVFRGLTVCFMIVVNTPGSGATPFSPLLHANWHGFTPTDLVFPSFLFAVGNAMSFAQKKFGSLPTSVVLAKLAKRTALIFLLGYLMYWFPFFQVGESGDIGPFPISETRIWGVLQRIGVCYGIASLLVYFFPTRTVITLSIAFLVGYWLILLGWGDPADPFGLSGNAVRRFDRFLIGDAHLYTGDGIPFDPEGLLSTLPAIVNVIIGYYAGQFVQRVGKNYESTAKLLLAGAALIFAALCWDLVFPINKKLWTSSFVLLTTGLDLTILATLIYVIEIRHWNRANWTQFFVIPGKNPLFIYLLSELLAISLYLIPAGGGKKNLFGWLNSHLVQPMVPGAVGSLLFALTFMLLCWSVGWLLDRRKIYVRV